MASADLFVLLDDVQYKKNEWQNRNRIRNAKDWQWLSVPNSYQFPQLIMQVRVINEQPWQEKHWRSLEMCYRHAPHFEDYASLFEHFYSRSWDTMAEVSIDSIALLASAIGITTPQVRSSTIHFPGVSTERLVNICRHFGADTYIAGCGGKDYLDENLFHEAGINLEYQQFTCPAYPQHWSRSPEEFIPNLSALDLIFNCGPESLTTLMS
jgi:hypothetical protein